MFWWLLLLPSMVGWNLTGLLPHEVPLGQVAIWRNRAYLSVPRLKEDTVPYTLLEASWPQNLQMLPIQPRAYPSSGPVAHEEGHCPALQNVTALDVDSARARLWVLDSGTQRCGPKVVSFDLRRNQEVLKVDMQGIEPMLLSSIVADPMFGVCYVGGNGSFLLLVGPRNDWRRMELNCKSEEVSTVTLAMSRQALYLTSPDSHHLHSIDLPVLRTVSQNGSVEAKYLGSKLGKSQGLVADWRGGLSYFLPRDHVVVRWDTKKPLIAEYHTVLHQSAAALPKVSHLLQDRYPGSALWAVVHQHCTRVHKFSLF